MSEDPEAYLRPEWGDATGLELWRKVHDRKFTPDPGDPPETQRAIGYEHLVVTRRARQWLRASHPGIGDAELEHKVNRAYEAWGQDRPSLRETQAVGRIYDAARAENEWRDGTAEVGLGLSRVELELIAEHFAGANDPVAQSLLRKATAELDKRRTMGD